MRLISNIGLIILSVYLILIGLTALIPGIVLPTMLYGILAILAGVFILIGK